MKKIMVVLVLMALSIFFAGPPAWALVYDVDPATLHIGTGAGTANAIGNLQNDPTFVSTTNFSIYQNQGGAINISNPLVLLLAVPNTVTLTGGISSATLYNPYSAYPNGGVTLTATAGVNPSVGYGTLTNTSGAFQTTMTSGDLYSTIGLGAPVGNGSFNWSNFTSQFLPNGSPNPDYGVTSFSIYAYSLTSAGANLGEKGLANIFWSGAGLPNGTFIAAFGTSPANHGKVTPYSVPFTQAGLVGTPPPPPPKVPEPSSLLIFGSGLLGLGLWGRKRFMH